MDRTQKRILIGVGIGGGVLALCCVASLLAAAFVPDADPQQQAGDATTTTVASEPAATEAAPPATSSTVQQPADAATTPSGPFDRTTFDAWWVSGAVPPSVQQAVESVGWNGVTLVAETSIVPDGDAEAAAQAVCSALSAFWLTTGDGQFRPVQVVGTDGGVLVSRANLGSQCEWRRN